MVDTNKYISDNIRVNHISEKELPSHNGINNPACHPIVLFNDAIRQVRGKSNETQTICDEIEIARMLKANLRHVSETLRLPEDHFSIDISGDPMVVSSGQGQHYILPTHFERGSYFSSPHFDHELDFSASQIPSIRIGKYVQFGIGSCVNVGGDLSIGDYVWIAPGAVLLRQEHSAYGQPGVAARTVSMTKQPGICMSDYAWIGKDAIVGWNCGYVGKASIVGSRSFVNKWVGDYSIVGDHSRILAYLPYKAYFLEQCKPSFEQVLRISDWQAIYDDWQSEYASSRYSTDNMSLNCSSHFDV